MKNLVTRASAIVLALSLIFISMGAMTAKATDHVETVAVTATVTEAIGMTLGSATEALSVDPSVSLGVDSDNTTTFSLSSNSADGWKVTSSIASGTGTDELYDSLSKDTIANTSGGGENAFAFSLTGAGSNDMAFSGTTVDTGITDNSAVAVATETLDSGDVIGTFSDTLYYYLNVDYTTAAGTYTATITYTMVATA